MDERGDPDAKYLHFAFAADRARVRELRDATELAARTRDPGSLIAFEARYRDDYELRRAGARWAGPLEATIARAEAALAGTPRGEEARGLGAAARARRDTASVARVVELAEAVSRLERVRHIAGYPALFADEALDALARLFEPAAPRSTVPGLEHCDDELLERFQTALELCADPWAPNIGLGAQFDRIVGGGERLPGEPMIETPDSLPWTRGVLSSMVRCTTANLDAVADAIEMQGVAFVASSDHAEQLRDEIAAAEEDGDVHEYADLWLVVVASEADGEAFAAALDAYAAAVRDADRRGDAILAWTTKSGSL